MTTDAAHQLIASLQNPRTYPHVVSDLHVLQTHISWVVLTGPFAYKLKKPVDLGFVDFTTLEKREFYCREELRLNRRLAPQLYLDVLPITGTPAAPVVGGDGPPIEFAVKMTQFPQESLLSHVLQRGKLSAAHIDALADDIAAFHRGVAVAGRQSQFGTPERVLQPAEENFRHLGLAGEQAVGFHVKRLHEWSRQEFADRHADFAARQRNGFVRECHGDMHLGNMILADDRVVIFDCLEFNESFRWIDVVSEVAFLAMDLEDRGRADFARRLLNRYLEATGDYAGLMVLPFYLTYRALVRAKVACLRLSQPDVAPAELQPLRDEFRSYLELAERYTVPRLPSLFVAHGLSGSGKTFGTQPVVESLGAIRLRSDIERKRLFGLNPLARTGSRVDADFYSDDATHRTYGRLEQLAEVVLEAGFSVIVDATFLKRWQRNAFRHLAQRLVVPFRILDFEAAESTLRERIGRREAAQSDASEATLEVLSHQVQSREPLADDERPDVIHVDSEDPQATARLLTAIGQ